MSHQLPKQQFMSSGLAVGAAPHRPIWGATLAFWSAVVFLAILPLAHSVALRYLALVLLTFSAAALYWRTRPHAAWPPLAAPLLAWLLLATASLGWTADFDYSQGELRSEVIYPALAFFSCYVIARTEQALRRLLATLILAAAAVALLATVQYTTAGAWQTQSPLGVGDVGAYSTYAVLVLPLITAALGEKELKVLPTALTGSALLLVLIAATLTLNRALWLALVAALFAYLLLRGRTAEPTGRLMVSTQRKTLVLLAVGLTVLAAGFLLSNKEKALLHAPDGSAITFIASDTRLPIWQYALTRISERPLLGHGFGRGVLRQDFRETLGSGLMWHGHNWFLNTALELGLIGLAVLLWLLATLFRTLLRQQRTRPTLGSLGTLGIAILVGILCKNQFDDLLIRENALLFWSLMGLCLSQAEEVNPTPRSLPVSG